MNQGKFTFSRKNYIFLGVCLGGITLLLLIGLIPLKTQRQALEQEVSTLNNELATQRQNLTSIVMVEDLLTKLDQQLTPQAVTLTPLPQDKTALILEDIKMLATDSSLNLDNIKPQLNNKNNWQSLIVRTELRGSFPNLRSFLLKLLALPYVKQIDHLEIHPNSNGLEFSLTYTIALV